MIAVSITMQGTADATGRATALYSGAPGVTWRLGLLSASGTSTQRPELRVARNGVVFAATSNANADTSVGDALVIHPGDVLSAEWTRATPGARFTLTAEGERV